MSERAPSFTRSAGDLAIIALFSLALVFPMGGRFLDSEADVSTQPELRRPVPAPRWPHSASALAHYPGAFENWLNDRFGFRGTLIRWHNVVKVFGFGASPTDALVVGPERWIFTASDRAIEAHRGLAPLSDELLELWKNAFEQRRDWLRERGVRYLVVLCPGKPTIYPEQLPRKFGRGSVTPLDQVVEYMERSSDVELLDLRAPLLAARSDDGPGDWLYYPYGTHWTQRGNHVAYVEIMRRLGRWFPDLDPWPASAFERQPSDQPGDHWGWRLRMKDLLPHGSVVLRPLRRRRARCEPGEEQSLTGTVTLPDPGLPRALVIHDSYGFGLWDFLGEHFSRLHSSGDLDLDPDLIAVEEPDLVLQVMVERKLLSMRPTEWGLWGATARETFEASREVLLSLEDPATLSGLDPWRHAELTVGERGRDPLLALRCRWSGQGVVLPSFQLPKGRSAIVRVDLECPKETELTVLYKTVGQSEYIQKRSVGTMLTPGHNVFHLALPAPDLVDRLVVLFGARGTYELNELEVRGFTPGE